MVFPFDKEDFEPKYSALHAQFKKCIEDSAQSDSKTEEVDTLFNFDDEECFNQLENYKPITCDEVSWQQKK